jgi:hypothetical protein
MKGTRKRMLYLKKSNHEKEQLAAMRRAELLSQQIDPYESLK